MKCLTYKMGLYRHVILHIYFPNFEVSDNILNFGRNGKRFLSTFQESTLTNPRASYALRFLGEYLAASFSFTNLNINMYPSLPLVNIEYITRILQGLYYHEDERWIFLLSNKLQLVSGALTLICPIICIHYCDHYKIKEKCHQKP